MEQLVYLVLLFFAYSFIGWIIEVVGKYRQFHRFINRGFLTGPWLPIYGTGTTLITVVMGYLSRYDSSYGTTFIVSFFLCGTVEYLVSYVLEKKFHARWWDYSQRPMNLHGRVWIGNLILFGLAGVLVFKVTNPLFLRLFQAADPLVLEIIAGALTVIIITDYIVSHFVLKLVKVGVESSEADNTEEISKEVKLLLSDRSVFYRRFADAYPDVIYRTERIAARMDEIRLETERLRTEAEARIDVLNTRIEAEREQLVSNLEPTSSIKNALIDKQGALIELLYDESSASEEAKALKNEIDLKTEKIQQRRQALRPDLHLH